MLTSRVWPLVLVAALGIVPVGPQEHVHEETDEAGHHTLIAHRHAALHAVDAAVDASALAQTRKADHPDPIALFPDSSYRAPSSFVLHAPLLAATVVLETPVIRVVHPRPRSSDQLIHAPPRAPSSLRAPPLSTRL